MHSAAAAESSSLEDRRVQRISYLFLALTTLLSVMRIVALYQNYHASMDIWRDLNHMSYSEESSYKPGEYKGQ